MAAWRYVTGASILGLWLSAACTSGTNSEPIGQSGRAGAAAGGDSGSGGVGTAGKAGSDQQGGAAGGGADSPEGGSDSAGNGGAAASGPYRAMVGQWCPVESTLGFVEIKDVPQRYVQVTLYDRIDPWIGQAELTTPSCEFHRYDATSCPECPAGEVCSIAGACVPERRTVKDATLLVTSDGAQRQYSADPQLGGISSMLDIGDATSSYAMTLSWGETEVQLDAMAVASAMLANAVVTTENGTNGAAPGALDATWEPAAGGAFVRSRIPINHHAGGPTFTECRVPESAGSFHADADMIDPLAVETGLEFQGFEHLFIAAAETPAGCVEFRFGAQVFAAPN
jgi:hypothetical protein